MVQNKEMFNVIGYLYGDGWIYLNRGIYYICGFSGDIEDLETIKNILNNYYNPGKCTISTRNTVSEKYNINGTTNSFVCSPAFSKILVDEGVHCGKRVDQEVSIPDFLKNATLEQRLEFIAGFYAADGEVINFQKNNKTPRPPVILLTKRVVLEDNLFLMVNYITDTLDSINIKYSIEKTFNKTCDNNIRVKIIINNSLDNMLKFLFAIGDRMILCSRKLTKNKNVKKYLLFKKIFLKRLLKGYLLAKYTKESPKKISNEYNVKIRQVRHWRDDKKCGYKLPKDFIKFSDFNDRYCSP